MRNSGHGESMKTTRICISAKRQGNSRVRRTSRNLVAKVASERHTIRAINKIVLLCWCLLLGAAPGLAIARDEMPSLSDRDVLINWVLQRFWGTARDSSGALIQPDSDLDRRTVPISTGIAYRAIEAGEISGLAAWCDLKWDPHYRSLTAAARQRHMPDKSIAFISMLHGVAQGLTLQSAKSSCSKEDREAVTQKLKLSTEKKLDE